MKLIILNTILILMTWQTLLISCFTLELSQGRQLQKTSQKDYDYRMTITIFDYVLNGNVYEGTTPNPSIFILSAKICTVAWQLFPGSVSTTPGNVIWLRPSLSRAKLPEWSWPAKYARMHELWQCKTLVTSPWFQHRQ